MSTTVTVTSTPDVSGSSTPVTRQDLDIEHAPVQDDPRLWSCSRKWLTVAILSWAAMLPSMAANIWFPALEQIRIDLDTTDSLIALTVSLYILFQGVMPLAWAPLSDVFGRKPIFIVSLTLFTLASALAGIMSHIASLIIFRLLQATGSSAVLSIAAGSLAEIYEPHERGRKLGIYYTMPILGPAISPFLGGLLTEYASWRASFWFIAGCGASNVLAFLFYKDTYRRERSLVWQVALARQEKTLSSTVPRPCSSKPHSISIRPRFADLSPLASAGRVLSHPHNWIALSLSGIIFASNYVLNFSATRTFAAHPYNLNPLQVGSMLLTMGIGGVFGSLAGGWYSDRCIRARPAPDGTLDPEQRIRSILPVLILCPMFMMIFAWTTKYHVHIGVSAFSLFVIGLTQNWAYSATLSYMVDTNPGRSTGAIAVNSMFRGVSGCVGSLIANPLQQAVGIGAMFTAWAALIAIVSVFAALLVHNGRRWREIDWGRSK